VGFNAVATDGHGIKARLPFVFCRVRKEKGNERSNSEMTDSQKLPFPEEAACKKSTGICIEGSPYLSFRE